MLELIEPVYVSEVVERTMNPTFGTIDWSGCGAGILRGEEVVVKVWAKEREREGWATLLQSAINLRGLVYLGKNVSEMLLILVKCADTDYHVPSS